MTINELKEKITMPFGGMVSGFYVFYGDEWKVQSVYVQKIAEVSNADIQYIQSIQEVYANSGSSLFDSKKCFVGVELQDVLKFDNFEKSFERISEVLGENILILQFYKLDKRSKFYNFIKDDRGVEFEHLHPIVLEKHILEEINMSPNSVKRLIEVCEQDYGRALLEIDKIQRFSQCENISCDEAFKRLLDTKTIYQPPGDKIFEFVGAVLAGKPKLSFSLLRECKDIGEPSLRLLLVMFTNIRHLLQVQSCKGAVAETTGLSNWEIRNVQPYVNVYKISELVGAMRLIREVEVGIKTGQIEEQMAVDYVLVNMF
ncbi:MAG: hypothetical protein J6Y78_15300 [Paludibacteraceae bacterium]|nr:hypothetical protein [Paludibacteraceae bacterium]